MYNFISQIYYLDSNENSNFLIHNGHKITNLFYNEINEIFGRIAYTKLSKGLLFCQTHDSDRSFNPDEIILINNSFYMQFSFSYWLIKDNSIFTSETYVINREIDFYDCTNNHVTISNSIGEFEIVNFSQEDHIKRIEYNRKIQKILTSRMKPESKGVKAATFEHNIIHSSLLKNPNIYDNFTKSYQFISLARTTLNLVEKISFYVVALENLFVPDGKEGEISYKASLRIAEYFGIDKNEKIEIKSIIKGGYTIRSNFFHGGNIDKKYVDLQIQKKISKKLDELLRTLFLNLINDTQNTLNTFENSKTIVSTIDSRFFS